MAQGHQDSYLDIIIYQHLEECSVIYNCTHMMSFVYVKTKTDLYKSDVEI